MAKVRIERAQICPDGKTEVHSLVRVWVDGKVLFDGAFPYKQYEDMSDDDVLIEILWWVPDGFRKIVEALGGEVETVDNIYDSVDQYEKEAE